jgi:hypothetical protein
MTQIDPGARKKPLPGSCGGRMSAREKSVILDRVERVEVREIPNSSWGRGFPR